MIPGVVLKSSLVFKVLLAEVAHVLRRGELVHPSVYVCGRLRRELDVADVTRPVVVRDEGSLGVEEERLRLLAGAELQAAIRAEEALPEALKLGRGRHLPRLGL